MKQFMEEIERKAVGIRESIRQEKVRFVEEERGDIGIKQIAITVGVIILVGAAVAALSGNIGEMLTAVWDMLFEKINDIAG